MSGDGGVDLGFTPHLTHSGSFDEFLGINLFWSEKFMVLVLYLQRAAIMLLWTLNWPVIFYTRMTPLFGMLLDLTAYHTSVPPLGVGTYFEGCETICKLIWPSGSLTIMLLWVGLHLVENLPTYYTRNIERILWSVVRIMLLPFMNTLLRYFVLNHTGHLENPGTTWRTPISEIGVILALATLSLYFGVGYYRMSRQVLFNSQIRHEAYIRARELEYLLRFSTTFRNERIWMISSYMFAAWPWALVRSAVDILLLVFMTFLPAQIGIIAGASILTIIALYGTVFVRTYRCSSTCLVEAVLDWAMVIFAIFGALQVYQVRNALLVDSTLDYFLFAIHGGAVALFLVLCIYFFVDGHSFGIALSVAEKRARAKWRLTFLNIKDDRYKSCWSWCKSDDEYVEFKDTKDGDGDDQKGEGDDEMDREAFVKAMKAQEQTATTNRFYVPKVSTIFGLNTASDHVWPVNGIVVNELLRRNVTDHLVDVLRAARKMLDRISALHNTPVLIPTDELKTHINRLRTCVTYVSRQRVTHHCAVIHPLQTTFEDLIDQFTYELRVFSGRSVTQGHNARKMIEVSRYLRLRMEKRDRTLALVSPGMRRILMKLFALRIFIQLVEERPQFLLPQSDKPFADPDVNDDAFKDSDEDDDDGKGAGAAPITDYVAFGEDDGALEAFERAEDAGLSGDQVVDDADEQAALLAAALKDKKEARDKEPKKKKTTRFSEVAPVEEDTSRPGTGGSHDSGEGKKRR